MTGLYTQELVGRAIKNRSHCMETAFSRIVIAILQKLT